MSTYRRLRIDIDGSPRGLIAALNLIDAGLGRTQNRVRQTNREMSLWERQIMAIGTTARYALAGQFVFGITAAITRLTDFNNSLGQVAALAGELNRTTGQYTPPTQGLIENVGDQAILESNKLGVATESIQAYMTRFFSAFQPPPGTRLAEMRGFVDEVARLEAMLGAEAGNPQELAGGIAGLVNQVPGGRRNIAETTNRVANLISFMLAETPNITGRDIARDIGRIGATMTQANMTPEQAFAVWGLAGKAGGSASVIGRGIAQLLGTSLLHPQTPEQLRAYQSIGLPTDPNMLARRGGMNVLMDIMERVAGRVRIRNPQALANENVDDETALAAAGVTGANRTLLYNLFGRQESVRQFINLIGQGGVRALKEYITVQDRATKSNAARAREDAAQRQRALARFTTARQNLGLGLARGIEWPLENIVAPPVEALSNTVTRHRTATQVALGTLFGTLALRRARRLFTSIRGRRNPAAALASGVGTPSQELVGSLLAAESLPNVLAGGKTDGTRANPYWVIIHPDSWFVGQPGGSPWYQPSGVPGTGTTGGKGARVPRWMERAARATGKYGGPAALLTGAGIAAFAGGSALGNALFQRHGVAYEGLKPEDMTPAQRRLWEAGEWVPIPQPKEPDFLGEVYRRQNEAAKLFGFRADQPMEIRGEGKADLTIRLVDEQGRPIGREEKKGVPLKFAGAKQAPTYKGKQRANKVP